MRGGCTGEVHFKGITAPSMPASGQRRWVSVADLRSVAQKAFEHGCVSSPFLGTGSFGWGMTMHPYHTPLQITQYSISYFQMGMAFPDRPLG